MKRTHDATNPNALSEEIQRAQALEVAAVLSLNAKLALHLEHLVDQAVARATDKKKPDIRLLRMIVRYAGTANRRFPGLSGKAQRPSGKLFSP